MVAATQAIAGVSSSSEAEIEAVYPSIAANALGQVIGVIMGGVSAALPILILRLPAMIIVGAVMIPLGLLAYACQKLFGTCYVVTNRGIHQRKVFGYAIVDSVTLTDIDNIDIVTQGGYEFHRVGDVVLQNASGAAIMTIAAIQYPERLRQIILDARAARMANDESLAHIRGRG